MRLLEVEDLRTSFSLASGELSVLDGISFHVDAGEVLGLVGESGSGKTVTALSVIGLLRAPGRVVGGRVTLNGRDLTTLDESAYSRVRGGEIAMVFQNARASLNPVSTIGSQLMDALKRHRGAPSDNMRRAAVDLLRSVHIADAERRMDAYPHELSGGIAQRVMIAIALACRPRLLIADEPTSGLDVTVQHEIITLLREIRDTTGMAVLLITHDLAVAADLCDRIAVLYAGRVAESGDAMGLLGSPRHPYTAGLIASRVHIGVTGELAAIPGQIPDLASPPPGCRFHPRCPRALPVCEKHQPALLSAAPGHAMACHNPIPPSQPGAHNV